MPSQDTLSTPDARIRVSRIERFFPNFAYSIVGLGGGVAGLLIIRVLDDMTHTETQGIGRVATGLSNVSTSLSAGLIVGALVGFAALILLIGMLFGTRKTASPSVLYTLIPGLTGLASAAFAWPCLRLLILAPLTGMDFGEVRGTVFPLAIAAVSASALTVVLSLVLSFIPARSRPGRKYGPPALMVLMGSAMVLLAAFVSYQMYSVTHFYGGR